MWKQDETGWAERRKKGRPNIGAAHLKFLPPPLLR